MSSWIRQAQGRPAKPSEREQWLSRTWLAVRAERRRVEAEFAEQRRQADLPRQQAELLDRAHAMQRDPFAQRIRAEAAQLAARRQVAWDRRVARMRDERAAEERAKEILRTEHGWDA